MLSKKKKAMRTLWLMAFALIYYVISKGVYRDLYLMFLSFGNHARGKSHQSP